MEERRRNGRWQINKSVRLNLSGEYPVSLDGLIEDISNRGVKVSLRQKLPKEVVLNIDINLTEDVSLKDLEITVAWHKEAENLNSYGVSFKKIRDMDKDKIYNFVYKNFPQQIREQWWKGIN